MPDVTRATQKYLENTPNKLYLYVGIQDAIDAYQSAYSRFLNR